jgi:hypothetical protein
MRKMTSLDFIHYAEFGRAPECGKRRQLGSRARDEAFEDRQRNGPRFVRRAAMGPNRTTDLGGSGLAGTGRGRGALRDLGRL